MIWLKMCISFEIFSGYKVTQAVGMFSYDRELHPRIDIENIRTDKNFSLFSKCLKSTGETDTGVAYSSLLYIASFPAAKSGYAEMR